MIIFLIGTKCLLTAWNTNFTFNHSSLYRIWRLKFNIHDSIFCKIALQVSAFQVAEKYQFKNILIFYSFFWCYCVCRIQSGAMLSYHLTSFSKYKTTKVDLQLQEKIFLNGGKTSLPQIMNTCNSIRSGLWNNSIGYSPERETTIAGAHR